MFYFLLYGATVGGVYLFLSSVTPQFLKSMTEIFNIIFLTRKTHNPHFKVLVVAALCCGETSLSQSASG